MSGAPLDLDAIEAPTVEKSRGHIVQKDIAWGGSGRDGDPWVKVAWDTERCHCSQPWRHG